jgi:hypothetical protein
MLLRLRITLLDQPGSLGRITRVLGVAGADITQIVVLDRGEGRALDDITVYWPDAAPRQSLIQALESVSGVIVEGVWNTREGPDTYPELEILKYITTAGDRALATLLDSMPVLFSSDWAAAGPKDTPSRPTAFTLDSGPHSGLHVITAPLPPLALTFLLARADGPAFHRTEVHRLTRILEIFLTLPAVERGVARQSQRAD